MINLNALPVFIQVAKTKSFTSAANNIGMTASAVSKIISKLEKELGILLFQRTTRNVNLTDDGIVYFEQCQKVIDDLNEAETSLSNNLLRPHGKLRVSIVSSIGRNYVLPALPKFIEQFSDLQIEIELVDRDVDLTSEGFDLAICKGLVNPDINLIQKELIKPKIVFCATPGYLKKYKVPRNPKELSKHNFYGYSGKEGQAIEIPFTKGDETVLVSLTGNLVLNNAEARLIAVLAGKGITGIPNLVAAPAIKDGLLKTVLSDWTVPVHMNILLVHSRSRQLSAKVRVFSQFILDLFSRELSRNDYTKQL